MGIKNMIVNKASEKVAERLLSSLTEEQMQDLQTFADHFNGMTDEEIETVIVGMINKSLGNPDPVEEGGDSVG